MMMIPLNLVLATCSVTSGAVKTFDLVNYILPPVVRPCSTVLAMDCGASETFVVNRGYDKTTGFNVSLSVVYTFFC